MYNVNDLINPKLLKLESFSVVTNRSRLVRLPVLAFYWGNLVRLVGLIAFVCVLLRKSGLVGWLVGWLTGLAVYVCVLIRETFSVCRLCIFVLCRYQPFLLRLELG